MSGYERPVRIPFIALLLLLLCCAGRSLAQLSGADWAGGSAAWSSSPENWHCQGSIADLDGDCIPNSSNTLVTILNGSTVFLTTSVTTNTLFVDGGSNLVVDGGVSLNNTLEDQIGVAGTGTLTINPGGVVNDSVVTVGLAPGSNGTVIVNGPGAQWSCSSGCSIGAAGSGTVTIQNGGVLSGLGSMAVDTGSSGTVTVTGAGSQWNATMLNVGVFGNATINVQNGGVVNVSGLGASLGSNSGADATVTVTGSGSQFNAPTAPVYVGGGGLATLVVDLGATGSSLSLAMAGGPAGAGTMLVSDPGSQWSNGSGGIDVGYAGVGSIHIQNGATFTDAGPVISVGVTAGSAGSLTVDGTGTKLSALQASMHVGDAGKGTLLLQNGASITSAGLLIGVQSGSQGSVTITDPGTLYTNANFQQTGNSIIVGNGGQGSLTLTNSAMLKDNVGTFVANGGGLGTLSIDGGAELDTVDAHVGAQGVGTLNVTNSLSKLVSTGSLILGMLGQAFMNVTAGGSVTDDTAVLESQHGAKAVVTGIGSQWDNGTSLQVGLVNPGTLLVSNGGLVSAGTITSPGSITIGPFGSVDAKGGTLQGDIRVLQGGLLDPLGIANIVGGVTMNPGSFMEVYAAGTGNGQQGVLDISGASVFNGTLVVDFINGFSPKTGDTFTFIQDMGGESGNFQNIQILGLQPGFQYNVGWGNGNFMLTALSNGGTGTPEPASLLLMGGGLLATVCYFRRLHARDL